MENQISSIRRPPQTLLQRIEELPPEVVDVILDNATLLRVLRLLSHGVPYFEKCVFAHHRLGPLFRSPAELAYVMDLFLIMDDIHRFTARWANKSELRNMLVTNWDYDSTCLPSFLYLTLTSPARISPPNLLFFARQYANQAIALVSSYPWQHVNRSLRLVVAPLSLNHLRREIINEIQNQTR